MMSSAMRCLNLTVVLVFLLCGTALAQTVLHDDSRLNYYGRGWKVVSGGRQTPWESGQIRFKISGATQLTINTYVVDPDATYYSRLLINVDGSDVNSLALTTAAEIYTGNKSATLNLTADEHEIIVKGRANYPVPNVGVANQIQETAVLRFLSFEIADTATLSPWPQTGTPTLCVGDSWMALIADWPVFLPSNYSLWPVAYGGATASAMNTAYAYDAWGAPKAGDPAMDIALVSYGVNDYNGGVSVNDYQASLLSLVDKIKADHASIQVYLVQTPRNTRDSRNYDQYGVAMQNIAGLRTNVTYLSTEDIWGALTWAPSDPNHLDYAGRVMLANWVASALEEPPATGVITLGDGSTVPAKLGDGSAFTPTLGDGTAL